MYGGMICGSVFESAHSASPETTHENEHGGLEGHSTFFMITLLIISYGYGQKHKVWITLTAARNDPYQGFWPHPYQLISYMRT